MYSEIELYNNKIYSIDPILIHADKTIDLYVLTPEEGYDFAGYRYEDIECYDSFAVVTDSIILEPHYTPIDYSVKFYFVILQILREIRIRFSCLNCLAIRHLIIIR